ncbi:hypothetical protein GGC47_001269 [Bosea sp. OAE752]|jgi:hypothetical protein|uniref:Uncharacterized protein n=1 Tax=Bosea spartocytisi TaxID=2773451 RepID=A0A927HYX7_9HYPH|nr:hypothetical protein [Bosea spartocytisi]MBD3845684.1 hypothetical protein [Bosea spartocytisi]MCT4472977.1 hypothetical protein [Bosea spartocytisi]
MIETVLVRHVLPAVFAAAIMLSSAHAADPIQLITRQEAALPAAGIAATGTRNLTRGPGIDTLPTPDKGVDGKPFRLAVRFVPSNGVPVDPSTVRVFYRRQPPLDITERVKTFITPAGIDAPAVVVPPGTHVIEIEATDKEGRIGRRQLQLTVAPSQ